MIDAAQHTDQDAVDQRLRTARTVWLGCNRPDGPPHLTPIWACWDGRALWMCTSSTAVKARLLAADPRVTVALEDGDRPIVAEGTAVLHARPYPDGIVALFRSRFDWDITATDDPDGDFEVLLEVVPSRWLLLVP